MKHIINTVNAPDPMSKPSMILRGKPKADPQILLRPIRCSIQPVAGSRLMPR